MTNPTTPIETLLTKLEETDSVDEFRTWERTHNRENYGRYDAFRAGHKHATPALLEAFREVLGALQDVLGCPYVVDEDTVPKAGVEAARPYDVIGTMHISFTRHKNAVEALAKANEIASQLLESTNISSSSSALGETKS